MCVPDECAFINAIRVFMQGDGADRSLSMEPRVCLDAMAQTAWRHKYASRMMVQDVAGPNWGPNEFGDPCE